LSAYDLRFLNVKATTLIINHVLMHEPPCHG